MAAVKDGGAALPWRRSLVIDLPHPVILCASVWLAVSCFWGEPVLGVFFVRT